LRDRLAEQGANDQRAGEALSNGRGQVVSMSWKRRIGASVVDCENHRAVRTRTNEDVFALPLERVERWIGGLAGGACRRSMQRRDRECGPTRKRLLECTHVVEKPLGRCALHLRMGDQGAERLVLKRRLAAIQLVPTLGFGRGARGSVRRAR